MSDRALVVIDVQNDFCPGGALPVAEGDLVVPVINRLAARFPRVVATQDWHPPGHVSFASSHPGRKPFESVSLASLPGRLQQLWPEHCLAGSRGAELHPQLDTRPFALIVRKGARRELDSYSAFFENDRRTPTGLGYYLQGLGVGEVWLAGLATDVCVCHSAMDALKLGFTVFLVGEACRGIDQPPGSLEERLAEMRAAGVRLVGAEEA
jgi:nicotinamidase/pyrazinamidase